MVNRIIPLLSFIGLALCQNKTIAVFDFENNGLSVNEVRTLTDRLRTELVQVSDFKVVERSKMDDILKEQNFQLSGCVDECLIEVGKMLGATSVVIGSIGKVGSTYTISARLVNAETGEIEKAISYDSKYNIDILLTTGMHETAMRIIGNSEDELYALSEKSEGIAVSLTKTEGESILIRQKELINSHQLNKVINLGRYKNFNPNILSKKIFGVDLKKITKVQAEELIQYLNDVIPNNDPRVADYTKERKELTQLFWICGPILLLVPIVLL